MTSTSFLTSAQATKSSTGLAQGRLARPINAQRADKLIRGLREGLAAAAADEAGTSAPRQYGYGVCRVETTRIFREIDANGKLHVVDVIAADEIDGVIAYLVDDFFVFAGDFPGQIRVNTGVVFSGRLKDKDIRIRLKRGIAGGTNDPRLVANTSVAESFVGTGLAYIYSEWTFIEGRFNGDPVVNVIARLRRAADPRGGAARWTFNPYVHIYDFLTKSKNIGGCGIAANLIDADSFGDSATWSDAVATVPSFDKTAILTTDTNAAAANHLFEFNQSVVPFNYGDMVQLVAKSGQAVPPNFSPGVSYHVIPVRHALGDFQIPAIALAASLADVQTGTFIAAGVRTKDVTVRKVGEIRHMSGFTYASNASPLGILRLMLESCGASIYLRDGKISITRNVFAATFETVTEDDLRGAFALSNRLPAADRATDLTGVYTSLLNLFQPKDYPTIDGGGVYLAADRNRPSPLRYELPFVGKAGVAQREATKALRRIRLERTVAFSGDLSLYRLQPGTIFAVEKPSLGLDANTTFEVRDHTLFVDIADDRPRIGIDIVGRQLEAEAFDLAATDEQLVEAAKIPGLENAFEVGKPGVPQIAESLFVTTQGSGVRARVDITWSPASGGFISIYRVSYKRTADAAFAFLPDTPDTTIRINDIQPSTYTFRVIALNTLGLASEPAEAANVVIAGLSAPPADPTGFFGQAVGAAGVILQWNRSTDLDVAFGGTVEISHQADIAGGLAGSSRLLASLDGNIAIAQTPFVRGTYYIRFVDQDGNSSGFAEWSTEGVRPVPFAQIVSSGAFLANDSTEDQITLQDDPDFAANGSGTLVFDDDEDWLTLPLEGGIDEVADIDTVADIDAIPPADSVAPEGFCPFATGIELAAPTRVLLEAVIETFVVDIAAGIDSIVNVDAIPNIDAIGAGTAQPGQATAWIEVRVSRDDVASDTFGPWKRLESAIFNHRSFEFRIQARSFVPTVNIRITQARILARELPVNV